MNGGRGAPALLAALHPFGSESSQRGPRSTSPLRVQLWSWNYEPEPTAMGPIASRWAEAMSARGHEVEVVTAHPHYPGPLWGRRSRPYRETRNGIPILRLPLVIGHSTTAARITEEITLRGLGASAATAMASAPRTWRWRCPRRSSACSRSWPAPACDGFRGSCGWRTSFPMPRRPPG